MASLICPFLLMMYLSTTNCVVVDQLIYPLIDTEILDFIDVIIGLYDNTAQLTPGCDTQYNHIQVRVLPIYISYPPFVGKPLLLFEFVVDLKVVLLQIILVTKDTYRPNILTLLPFNITSNPGKYRPGKFSVEDLEHLKFADLENDPDCNIRFERLADGSYSGVWPDCRSTILGLHPSYTVTLTCTYQTNTIPLFSNERSTNSPYVYEKTKCGVPIPYAPPGFVGACAKLLLQCPVLG
ncbi:unnamed protein product [Candidula unifasciata]|uniref:Uncharacterized protein n=1 Tax=Candidula unifasciata TaxID=100452 RepID=A0A8S3ZVZ1_9EUPU|nr:unnamed protein product [Candidula unifasciata]